MTTIEITFPELKAKAISVMNFIKEEYGWEKDSSFHTLIEDDLGISGDDASEMMDKFSKKYSVDLSGFTFSKYFSPEGNNSLFPLNLIVLTLLFVAGIIKYLLLAIFFIISRKIYNWILRNIHIRKTMKDFLAYFEPENAGLLTVRDLIVSAACGKFKQRDEVRFVLKKA